MLAYFKKSVAVVATVGALALGGSAVANAADFIQVPDVSGKTATAAVQILKDAGFTNVHIKGSDTTGKAIGTNYHEGVSVFENSAVLVIVK